MEKASSQGKQGLVAAASIEEYQDLVEALGADYLAIFRLNFTDECISAIKLNEVASEFFRSPDCGAISFADSFGRYVDGIVHPDDRSIMRKELLCTRIRKRLEASPFYYVAYRTLNKGVEHHLRLKLTRTGSDEVAIVGIQNVDAAYEASETHRRELSRANARIGASQSVISAVSNIYLVLYDIDLESNSFIGFRTTPAIERFAKQYTAADQCLIGLANSFFREEDHARALAFCDMSSFKSRFASEDTDSIELKDTKGVWRRVNLIVAARNDEGEPVHVLWAVQDIDDQKLSDEQYQNTLAEALASAQAANKAKTDFLNSMSHDIRTPMNAIVGFTTLAMTHIDHQEQVKDYLGKIITSSNHLLSLINDVLDMSRIESGKVSIHETECSLPRLMRDLRNILQSDIQAKQLDFFIDTFDVTDENVITDRLRLSQILLNVASNSVKYSRPGDSVSIRLQEKPCPIEGKADFVFTVKDTGIGMSPEFLKHVFEPFAREANSTVSGVQGTGLGLAIAKNIIDMMGGTIKINSEQGKGTETIITFRLALGSDQPQIHPIQAIEGMHALVVDDDMNVCESVTRMLIEIGLRPDWTTSGKEAVFRSRMAIDAGDPFHAYIIDWLMPDMNGVEVVRRIRREVSQDVPIIILTAYDWADIEDEAREAGVTAFCSKPLFVSELYDVLCKHVEPERDVDVPIKPSRDYAGTKVLLVEDNEINREIAYELMADDGLVVECAMNGKVAVERFAASTPGEFNLVLMDVQMPVMDGYEATRSIRALDRPDARGVPIVALTANAFNEDSEKAFKAGMNEYLTKPFHIDELHAVFDKYLS